MIQFDRGILNLFSSIFYEFKNPWKSTLPNKKFWIRQNWKHLQIYDKLNIANMMISISDKTENTVGQGENAGNQHFLLFQQCFQMLYP